MGEVTATGKLFGSLPAELLRAAGHDAWCDLDRPPDLGLVERDGRIEPRDARARNLDLVVLIRPADRRIRRFVRAARAGGAVVVHCVDDWLFGEGHRVGAYGGAEGVRSLVASYADVDGFVVSTPRLAENLAVYGKPTWLMRNCLWDRYWEGVQPRVAGQTVRIGWTGMARIRPADISGIGPALRQVLDANPTARFVTVADEVALEATDLLGHPQVESFELVPFEDFPRQLARIDIGIAPLAPVEVNACKSAIKLLEYWAAGAAAVVQRGQPEYEWALHEGEDGFLAGGQDEWATILKRLVADAGERRRVARAGRVAAQRHFASRVGAGYVSMFEEIASTLGTRIRS